HYNATIGAMLVQRFNDGKSGTVFKSKIEHSVSRRLVRRDLGSFRDRASGGDFEAAAFKGPRKTGAERDIIVEDQERFVAFDGRRVVHEGAPICALHRHFLLRIKAPAPLSRRAASAPRRSRPGRADAGFGRQAWRPFAPEASWR